MLLVALKGLHVALFLLLVASAVFALACGLTGRISRWTWTALAICLVELSALSLNHGICPLTTLAERLGARSGSVADLFLPAWTMPYVFPTFGAVVALGMALVLVRAFARRR